MYYNDVLDLIGNTPLMCLRKSTGYNIFAKAEFLNPGGSKGQDCKKHVRGSRD